MEDFKNYNSHERKYNSDFFHKEVLPELKAKYSYQLLNDKSDHNRFINGKNVVDYFPKRKRLCHVNTRQWFTVDDDEFIASRIIFLLNRK